MSNDDIDSLRTAYARISKPSEELFMTTAQKLIQQGLLRGRQEGRHEGRHEGLQDGRREGRVDLLLTQLQQRFGCLPESTIHRVRTGTATDLDLWARRVLTAPTLDAVLKP